MFMMRVQYYIFITFLIDLDLKTGLPKSVPNYAPRPRLGGRQRARRTQRVRERPGDEQPRLDKHAGASANKG